MFKGLHHINLDAKGRLAIPTRYRQTIHNDSKGNMVITIDTEHPCLLLYTDSTWSEIEAQVNALPSFDSQARRIRRLLIGHATDTALDNSGRLLIPPALRQYANLIKKTVLIGQGNKFEIWNDADWNSHRELWLKQPITDVNQLPEDLRRLSL